MKITQTFSVLVEVSRTELRETHQFQEAVTYCRKWGISNDLEPLEHKINLFLFLNPLDGDLTSHLSNITRILKPALKDETGFNLVC